jgi:hypothetical protein
MTATQSLNLYNLSLRYFKNENDAKSFVSEVEAVVDSKFESKKSELATKEDLYKTDLKIAETKADLTKAIYLVGLIQFLAIIGSVIGILSFMLKK